MEFHCRETDYKSEENATKGKRALGKREELILCGLAAFAGTYGISYLMNMRESSMFSFSVLTILLFVAIFLLLVKFQERMELFADRKQRKRRARYVFFVSFIFALTMVMGYQLQWLGYTEGGLRGRGLILIRSLCISVAAMPLVELLFAFWEYLGSRGADGTGTAGMSAGTGRTGTAGENAGTGRTGMASEDAGAGRNEAAGKKLWKYFAGCFGGIWLCWIPVWLAYYPVIMSYDFHRQSVEVVNSFSVFSTSQPLVHTLLIWCFRQLGLKIGSFQIAFALFALFQQMFLAAALGYSCVMIYRICKKRWVMIGTALFFGLFPLISIFACCTTKDVLFSAFFLFFLLFLLERFVFCQEKNRRKLDVLVILSGVLMVLFRGNAWYALLPFVLLLPFFCERREKYRILMTGVVLLLLGKGALAGIQVVLGAGSAAETEKYGAMIQCMARVAHIHGAAMPEETRELLKLYIPEEGWNEYNPAIVDGTKDVICRGEGCLPRWENTAGMLSAWLRIGIKYPNEYLDALLEVTRGYWFWDDTSHAEMLGIGLEERMGILYTYNSYEEVAFDGQLQHISKFPWLEEKLEEIVSDNSYYKYPVISNLFEPAFWAWALLLLVVFCLYDKKYRKLKILLYPLCYFATLLIGPTAIIRYIYPILFSVPVLFIYVRYGKESQAERGRIFQLPVVK